MRFYLEGREKLRLFQGKAYREECEKNRKLKSLLHAMMKYIVEEGEDDD
jgi:hypothetical protein